MYIDSEVLENKDYIVGLRRYFHQYPEKSMEEYKTFRKIVDELDKLGIEYKQVGETGVIAYLGKGGGPTVALRADIDALEIEDKKLVDYSSKNKGLMHACGHDGHTAALLGAAKILKAREDSFTGRIKLIFQQGEEIGQGARVFVEEGHLTDVDNVFGLHLASGLEKGKAIVVEGPRMASCDYFRLTVEGKSGHVATPHLAVDALHLASQIVVNLQAIVARQTDPIDPVVVGVGVLNSGTRYNIIAKDAVLEGTFRTFSNQTRERTKNRIESISSHTAESLGGSIKIEFKEFASPLINEEKSTDLAKKVGYSILGKDGIIEKADRKMGSDDFAEFLLERDGVYVNIGSKNPEDERTHYNHHHELFDLDEESLLIATSYYIEYALSYLRQDNFK